MTVQRHNSFINLDIHAKAEGRCLVQIGLDSYTPAERALLFRLLRSVTENSGITIGVKDFPSGELELKFTLPAKQAVTQ